MISFLKKTISGLTKTRTKLAHLFAKLSGKTILTVDDIEELEEALLGADIGWELTDYIIEQLKAPDKAESTREDRFQQCIQQYLASVNEESELQKVILLVGSFSSSYVMKDLISSEYLTSMFGVGKVISVSWMC